MSTDRAALRALFVEDSSDDATLALLELERAFGSVAHARVDTPEEFAAALAREWDVVICDHRMPRFSSTEALAMLRELGRDLPVIILSGSIGEDAAVAAMKRGASDYLLKDNLRRLAPAVERELREAEERRERRAAEQALRAQQLHMIRIIETSQEGIWTIDLDGKTDFVNARMAEMLGYTVGEMLGASLFDHIEEERRHLATGLIDSTRETGSGVADARLLRKDGSPLFARITTAPIVEEGRYLGTLAMVADVTTEKHMMSQLMLSDRLASVGTLAGGVAHEINSPLAVVLANLELIAGDLQKLDGGQPIAHDEVAACLTDARAAAERVRLIVRDLKVFSRPEEEKRGPVDVRAVMESSLRMAWNEIRHRARLVEDYGEVPPVEASEARLGQVFLNLVVNAVQAIPEGRAEDHQIRVATRLAADGRVIIEVQDTGVGIPAAIVGRVFDPFFTTKPIGVGTGLGLSICHRLVTGFGGEISIESEPGRGALFRVTLPAARADTPAIASAPSVASPVERRARVLVIDDEELIVRILQRVLSRDHDVVAATSARSGLEECLTRGHFDLILCDLMMPGMTGMELHAELARVAPSQAERMIFLTGGAFTTGAREFLERVPNQRLDKPFDPNNLRAVVRRALA